MGKVFEGIDDNLRRFIESQRMFFVATAPLSPSGHVNLSPKGLDTLRVLGRRTIAYLDYVGSGAETIARPGSSDCTGVARCLSRVTEITESCVGSSRPCRRLAPSFGSRSIGFRTRVGLVCPATPSPAIARSWRTGPIAKARRVCATIGFGTTAPASMAFLRCAGRKRTTTELTEGQALRFVLRRMV
jgi:hypothetical protein